MVKFKQINVQEIELQEIISFSKLPNKPIITILDDLTASQFNYLVAYADLLKLVYFIVKGTRKIAIFGKVYIALKIAKNIKVKAQVIYYHKQLPEKGLKTNLKTKHPKEWYVVKAYDANGKITAPFIETNIPNVECKNLSKYKFGNFCYSIIRNDKDGKVDIQELKKLRNQYLLSDL